jgi:hypothetical protein
MTVPVTSDLEGYQRYWSRWIRLALLVLGVAFMVIAELLVRIWRELVIIRLGG